MEYLAALLTLAAPLLSMKMMDRMQLTNEDILDDAVTLLYAGAAVVSTLGGTGLFLYLLWR